MAEAAAVIGLVSSIASLVDLSVKVVSRINDFVSQTSDVPQSFRSLASRLPLLSQTLRHIQTRAQAGQVDTDVAKQLDRIVSDILDQVAALRQCLDRIIPTTNASRTERLLKSLHSLAKDDGVRKVVEEVHHGIDVLALHQSTNNVELGDRILQQLGQLRLNSTIMSPPQPPPPLPQQQQQQQQQTFGLCLGQAPQIEPDAFVGRSVEVQTLSEWLSPGSHPHTQKVVSIVGMGGLGKTQLSLAYAREHGHRYSSVLWFDATDQSRIRHSLLVLSKTIFPATAAISSTVDDEDRRIEQVRSWLSESWNNQWLLIFDNYDDPSLPNVRSSTGSDIRSFFPIRAQGSILITTRFPKLTFTKRLMLRKLDDIDLGIAILSQRSGQNISQDEHARRLTVRLDGLPLALATAGTYIGQTATTCAEYLEAYESTWTDLHGLDAETLLEYEDRTLSSTWTLSLNHVSRQDEDAAELFKFFAFTSNQDIWYDLIHAGVDECGPTWLSRVTATKGRFDRAMAKLRDYSLVEVISGSYHIHPCVHDWLFEHFGLLDRESFLTALRCIEGNIRDELPHFTIKRRLIQHIQRLDHPRFQELWEAYMTNEAVLDTCDGIGRFYWGQGKFDSAEQMLTRALTGKEPMFGHEDPFTLNTVDGLGALYLEQGKFELAGQMLVRALDGKVQALGRKHPLTLETINHIAGLHVKQGKLDAAEQMLVLALEDLEQVPGREEPYALDLVCNIGLLYHDQNKLDLAEQMYARALAGYEQALGRESPSALVVLRNLGLLYKRQDQLDLAEQMYMRALAGSEQVLGREHQSTLETVFNLGILYRDQCRLAEMIKLMSTCGEYSRQLSGLLGKTLLRFSDESNAQIAFQQQVKLQNDVLLFHNVICDGCDHLVLYVKKRYICIQCEDVDLCGKCWDAHSTKTDEITTCSDHTFLEVSSQSSSCTEQDRLDRLHDRESWLQDLAARYRDHGTQEPTK